MNQNEPTFTYEDFHANCLRNANAIYVRDRLTDDGPVGTVKLSQLTVARQNSWIQEWWNRRMEPRRIVQ